MEPNVVLAKMDELLESLDHTIERSNTGLLRRQELDAAIASFDKSVNTILPHDSDPHRLFEKTFAPPPRTTGGWHTVSPPSPQPNPQSFVEPAECSGLHQRIAFANQVVQMLEPQLVMSNRLSRSEFYIAQGDTANGAMRLFRIMKRAGVSLTIIDPFLDDGVFPYVQSIEPAVQIHLLTSDRKPIFRQFYQMVQPTMPNLEARILVSGIHDRFIVVDDSEIWHVGTSLNGIGRQASVIKKIVDQEEANNLLSDFVAFWSSASPV